MRRPERWLGGARNAAWPVIELVAMVGVQVVMTPLLLHRLGANEFGLWVLLQTALLASAALSLGASAGLLAVLSGALHRGDGDGARAAWRWFPRRVGGVSAAVLAGVVAALAAGWSPIADAAHGSRWALVLTGLAWIAAT